MTKALTDEQLHAYVDNALTDEERREVDAWIAQDAAAAQKVRSYLEQNLALHALFDPVLAEPHTLHVRGSGTAANASRWLALAAAGVVVVLALPMAGLPAVPRCRSLRGSMRMAWWSAGASPSRLPQAATQ